MIVGHALPDTAAAAFGHATEALGHAAEKLGHGAEALGHGAEHGGEHAAASTPELPNVISFLLERTRIPLPGREVTIGPFIEPDSPVAHFLHQWEIPIFSLLAVLLLALLARAASSRRALVPSGVQNLVETAVEGLDNFVAGVLGKDGRHFTPFLGTLFLYIWIQNLMGLVPGFHSPTSSLNTTIALAVSVFLYVQYTGIRRQGIRGYLFHLAGEPRDAVGWGMSPLMFPLHIIGELAKPMSLSLRLFGNIFGEDTLIAVFVTLGVAALAFTQLPIGIPFQLPFLFLALLTSTIQALVFTLLSTIYFALMLPHGEHGADHDAAHGAEAHGGRGVHGTPAHGAPAHAAAAQTDIR
jgi:F-type H+-transporting ATPase subunit a